MKKYLLLIATICVFTLLIGCNNSKSTKKTKTVDPFNNPKAEYIKSRIEKVKGVSDICIADEDSDPNGQLHKKGGPTGLIYYVYDKAPTMETTYDDNTGEERPYKNTCEKGTDAGGSIEIYANKKNVKSRDDYLAGFDGGVLSSGSHKIKGTLLIRTSDELTSSNQKELEKAIINAIK